TCGPKLHFPATSKKREQTKCQGERGVSPPLAFLPVSVPLARQRLGLLLILSQPVIVVDGETFPRLFLAIGPDHRERADLVLLAQTEDVPGVAHRQVTAAALGEAPLRSPADLQADPGPDNVAVLVADHLDSEPVVAIGPGDVLQDADRGIHVTDDS